MKCINCDNEVSEFFVEEIECCSCGDLITIEYYHCTSCNTIWKSQNDEVIFSVGLDKPPFPEEVIDLFDKIEEEIDKTDREADSMSAFVHRCISCNTICFEVADGTYRCPECGFEWEVVKCE